MKRNVLLSAVTLMMTANVFAQAEDVTPAAFKFQERSVGPVEMFWGTGANPSIAELNVSGSIVTAVAPANPTEEEALSSGLSIVNSEFGNHNFQVDITVFGIRILKNRLFFVEMTDLVGPGGHLSVERDCFDLQCSVIGNRSLEFL